MEMRPKDLCRRLLQDIAEIQNDPYPNIDIHVDDTDITEVCLILMTDYEEEIHLTAIFPTNYPLGPPMVTIQTPIEHPNVFGDYICASILNTAEGWTPAYTLKAIAIQLLSFFSSDSIEQDYGGEIDILEWRTECWRKREYEYHTCDKCGFGYEEEDLDENLSKIDTTLAAEEASEAEKQSSKQDTSVLLKLPDEIMLLTLAEMDTRDVLRFSDASPAIKRIVNSYDFIRIRELQCFCLKKSFSETKLGIGISISGSRHRPLFRSEFDLLSQEAFFQNGVRYSIQGVKFDKWLPLPLNRRHWNQVRTTVGPCLKGIQKLAGMDLKKADPTDVLYSLMNNVVVQFSTDYQKSVCRSPNSKNSTLNHVSEKAIEGYFALFHLLLCIAIEDPSVVPRAQRTIFRFLAGSRTKKEFPDLGHVLIAALIAGSELTQDLTLAIIKEAILRNVVWMLDEQGAGMAELAYLEPTKVSEYRLSTTFEASKTSYRLLMFLKIFSQAVRPRNKSLVELRDALFNTHGAPPAGTSATMAQHIREINTIDSFPQFLGVMGICNIPSKTQFTAFLRRTITDSVAAGYSKIPMTQSQLYMIRRIWEPRVEKADGVRVTVELDRWWERGEKWHNNGWKGRPTFFSGKRKGIEDRRGGHGNTRERGR